ncbi:hypothetical protein pEaSNUABM29_00064 [Erwinia phage pEa_SNUABM_29]|nr:hypothetical protein pEaSNUABM29_00064 [Erwinia phage pEa_SNUABM_29]
MKSVKQQLLDMILEANGMAPNAIDLEDVEMGEVVNLSTGLSLNASILIKGKNRWQGEQTFTYTRLNLRDYVTPDPATPYESATIFASHADRVAHLEKLHQDAGALHKLDPDDFVSTISINTTSLEQTISMTPVFATNVKFRYNAQYKLTAPRLALAGKYYLGQLPLTPW